MTNNTYYVREIAIYLFSVLTLISTALVFYFAITGDTEQRNTAAISTTIGVFLVLALRKDQEPDKSNQQPNT